MAIQGLLHITLRVLTLFSSAYILGLSSHHISHVRPHLSKSLWTTSIISGAATLWALISLFILLLAKLAPFLLIPAAFLDLLFCGGMIAVAILYRRNAGTNCNALATRTMARNCNLNKAAFSFAVAAAVLFLLLAIMAWRRYTAYKKNRGFGPGPANNYSTAPAVTGPTVMKETGAGTFTGGNRYSGVSEDAAGYTRTNHRHGLGDAGYREPVRASQNARGSFDPELGHHEGQQVREYQAF